MIKWLSVGVTLERVKGSTGRYLSPMSWVWQFGGTTGRYFWMKATEWLGNGEIEDRSSH